MIERALKTWYPVDHSLHLDPKHPAIALAGEAGEILNLLKKDLFKPNFSWWNCRHCGYGDASHSMGKCLWSGYNLLREDYTPLILNELGDYSYYLRILTYQIDASFEEMVRKSFIFDIYDIEQLLVCLSHVSSGIAHSHLMKSQSVNRYDLQMAVNLFMSILQKLDVSLEKILEMNYRKLNSEESNHGWRGAS